MTKQIYKILLLTIFTAPLLFTGCNHLFYYPDSNVRVTPDKLDLKYDEISIATEDNEKLNGWYIHSKYRSPYATILHFHGNAENITTHFLYLSWLANYGYDIIVFDYRGYGNSTGTPSRDGLFSDSKAILKWIKNNLKTQDMFIVAQSLGGAVVIPAFVENPIPEVQAIILDSTFASYRKITRQKLSSIWLTWPLQWPLSFLISDNLSPVDYIKKIKSPILFIHSLNDPVVPFESGKALFEEAENPKELWELNEKNHCSALATKDDKYRKKLLSYLCEHSSQFKSSCEKDLRSKETTYIELFPKSFYDSK